MTDILLDSLMPIFVVMVLAVSMLVLYARSHVAGATLIASSIASTLTLPAVLVLMGG